MVDNLAPKPGPRLAPSPTPVADASSPSSLPAPPSFRELALKHARAASDVLAQLNDYLERDLVPVDELVRFVEESHRSAQSYALVSLACSAVSPPQRRPRCKSQLGDGR